MGGRKHVGGHGTAEVAGPLPRPASPLAGRARFELRGMEQADRVVASTSNCGRVYLPLAWVGKRVKIIRLD